VPGRRRPRALINASTPEGSWLHLAASDLCWRLAVEDLERRRPRRGDHDARDAWLAEKARLEAERKRLAAMVAETISSL
jgi:hypothetical protein